MSQIIRDEGWEVCGFFIEGKPAVEKTLELKPEVLILDYRILDRDGLADVPMLLCT